MGILDDSKKSVYLDGRVIIEEIFIEDKKEKDMKPNNSNKSLSARVRRRNKQGFTGTGNYCGVGPNHYYGDYKDPKQNHKEIDYKNEEKRKNKLGYKDNSYKFDDKGNIMYSIYNKNRKFCKKYADNHQKLS